LREAEQAPAGLRHYDNIRRADGDEAETPHGKARTPRPREHYHFPRRRLHGNRTNPQEPHLSAPLAATLRFSKRQSLVAYRSS
jgi:hypothetical protein